MSTWNPDKGTPIVEDAHAVPRINASWLVRLRWAAILGQGAVIAYVKWALHIQLPLGALTAILSIELALNAAFVVWLRRRPPVSEPIVALALAFDVSCFTGLLYFTGGPLNPFSFLYLVHIGLAAIVLQPRWTWTLVLFSVAASGALFVRHVPLPMDHAAMTHMAHAMHGGEPLDMHLRGMWVAFATAAALIVYFINRVTRALSELASELASAREVASRTEKLASMATLAAGAAHELATPLATIAVVSNELERAGNGSSLSDDARVIREQVERCRNILAQMAGGAGVSPGEMAARTMTSEIVRIALDGLPTPERVQLVWEEDAEAAALVVPPRATAQALRNVLRNGLDASPDEGTIELRVARNETGFDFEVTDAGTGMTADVLARATEPFFTTKQPGGGMGLGLFLTRSVIGSLGGSLSIESIPARGTKVVVRLPSAGATNGRIAP